MGNKSYKNVKNSCSVSDIENACSNLEELGNECREIVDNAEGGLAETQRIQTFDETAGVLENVRTPDVPECVSDLSFEVTTSVSARKGRSESRAVRCSNECAILSAAAERVQTALDEDEIKGEDDRSEAEQFVNELEEIIGECDSLEFPGMFG